MRVLAICFAFSVLLVVMLFSCTHHPTPFDEGKWRRQVMEQQVEQLYAPHFKDGRYFNPWMPMDYGGFGRLLKWKLAGKAPYSEEAKDYRPQFIPDLKRRIQELPEGDFIAWIGHATISETRSNPQIRRSVGVVFSASISDRVKGNPYTALATNERAIDSRSLSFLPIH